VLSQFCAVAGAAGRPQRFPAANSWALRGRRRAVQPRWGRLASFPSPGAAWWAPCRSSATRQLCASGRSSSGRRSAGTVAVLKRMAISANPPILAESDHAGDPQHRIGIGNPEIEKALRYIVFAQV